MQVEHQMTGDAILSEISKFSAARTVA